MSAVDTVHKTNRFHRKELHIPPRTIGITADYVQYIIHTGLQGVLITSLCSLTSLSERVSYSNYATGCKIWVFERHAIFLFCGTTQPLIQRVGGFFPGGKVARAWS